MMSRQTNAQTSTTDTGSGGWTPREAGPSLIRPAAPSELPAVTPEETRGSALKERSYLKSQLATDFSLLMGDRILEAIQYSCFFKPAKLEYSFLRDLGFPRWCSGKEPACQCWRWRRLRFISGLGRLPGEGNGNPLQTTCLENPMDRGIWWTKPHRVPKNQIRLSTHTYTCR